MDDNTTAEQNIIVSERQWFHRLADELDKLEALMPFRVLPDTTTHPEWVLNVEREVSISMLPAAKLRAANYEITPKRMGALLGHMCAMAAWMMESLQFQIDNHNPVKCPQLTEAEIESGLKLLGSFIKWYEGVRRFAKLALCACVDRTYLEMRDFLLGYGDGFSHKPLTFGYGDFGSTTIEIYHYMLRFWPAIEKLKSVRQLHEELMKVFGANKVGDQKRIEKICQRIGLSFRKPGRPRNT